MTSVKIREGMGEMSESIFQAQPYTTSDIFLLWAATWAGKLSNKICAVEWEVMML